MWTREVGKFLQPLHWWWLLAWTGGETHIYYRSKIFSRPRSKDQGSHCKLLISKSFRSHWHVPQAKAQWTDFLGATEAWVDPDHTILLILEQTQTQRFQSPAPQCIAQWLVLISACDTFLAGTGPLLITKMQASAGMTALLLLCFFLPFLLFFWINII